MASPAIDYPLSDYPVLARLAVGRIKVTRLDGRVWPLAPDRGVHVMDDREHRSRSRQPADELTRNLRQQVEELQARVRAEGFRRLFDEKPFMDELSGDI